LRSSLEERRRSLSSGRASRGPVGRVSKDEDSHCGLMVRDGARAPPHHEERAIIADSMLAAGFVYAQQEYRHFAVKKGDQP
jgi:hypothetical protein